MNNQAAQTMPELPKPFQKAVIANRINTMAVRQGYEAGGYEKSPDLYTAAQMHQYARDYAAALSQTARVAAPGRYFADGPQGHFFADDLQLARDLVNLYDKDDDWTITDLRNPTGAAPAASGAHPDALPDGSLSKSTVKRVTALASPPVEGLVTVPRELTTSMHEAAMQEEACGNDFSDMWEAAIATYIFDKENGNG